MWCIFFIYFVNFASTQQTQSDCDFMQKVEVNQTYSIQSPGFPEYSTSLHCRWMTTCPDGYLCKLDCLEIDLTQTSSCEPDRLLVSRTGDPGLQTAQRYCGRGSLSITSYGRTISLGVIASQGARLKCTLTALLDDCQCDNKKPIMNRIVGGRQTSLHEYPSMAGVADLTSQQVICGATIIARRHLITAGHCVIGRREEEVAIVVGMRDLNYVVSFAAVGHKVNRFSIHPLYNSNTYDYDVALIELKEDLDFDDHVSPICLPFAQADTALIGQNLTVLGWGTLFPGGPTSDELQETTVAAIRQARCRHMMPYLTERQICTFTPGKDACQGDSGGPLLYTDPGSGRQYMVGVISHGQSCASGRPAVNSRVASFLKWIEDTTKADYCKLL